MLKLILAFLIFSIQTFTSEKDSPKLEIHITGAKSDQGKIRVLIFSKESGFPDHPQQAIKNFSLNPQNKSKTLIVPDLSPGKYAIAVIHDEDNDGKLTTNAVGYPIEKFGFSNNPKIYFGPPSFEKASFELKSESRRIQINLR